MHRIATLAVALLLIPTIAHASSRSKPRHPAQIPPTLRGISLAGRMSRALAHQRRITVRGRTVGQARTVTNYVLRYQATGRESVIKTGSEYGNIQVGKRRVSGLRYISIGTRGFRSLGGSKWYREHLLAAATALDAVSVGIGAPCCTALPHASRPYVTYRGMRSWHGKRVYVVSFERSAITQVVSGTVLIDAHSYLPRQYSFKGLPTRIHGSFTVSYGGSFSIKAPK